MWGCILLVLRCAHPDFLCVDMSRGLDGREGGGTGQWEQAAAPSCLQKASFHLFLSSVPLPVPFLGADKSLSQSATMRVTCSCLAGGVPALFPVACLLWQVQCVGFDSKCPGRVTGRQLCQCLGSASSLE